MKTAPADLRAALPAVFVALAVAAALFAYLPGAADPVGDARAALVLALVLAACTAGREALLRPRPDRVFLVGLGVFVLAVLVSLAAGGNPGRAFWGSAALWTGSATLLLAVAGAFLVAAAVTGRARSVLPAVVLGLLTAHQALFLLKTFLPAVPVPAAFAAAAPTAVALLSVIAMPLAFGYALAAGRAVPARAVALVAVLLHLAVLVRADRAAAWAALFVGLVVLLIHVVRRFDQVHRPTTQAAFVAAAAALVLSFVRLPPPLVADLPVEINVRQSETAAALARLWTQEPATFAGVGPGGFAEAFARVRPELLNTTALWNVRIPVPASTLLQFLYELGPVGTLALAVSLGASFAAGWKLIGAPPQVKGIRRVFARRVTPDADGAALAAGVFAAAAAATFAAGILLLPQAALLTLALLAGWLVARDTESAAKTGGRQALLAGWLTAGLLALTVLLLAAAVWLAAAQNAAGRLLRATDPAAQDEAYAALLRWNAAPEWQAIGALQALFRADGATDEAGLKTTLETALARTRAAVSGTQSAATLEAAITVGMQLTAAGADVSELSGWIAAARVREPSNPTFAVAAGDFADLSGDTAAAEAAYRDAVRIAPALLIARARLAGLLARTGRIDEAVRVAEEIAASASAAGGDPSAYLLLAQLLEQRGSTADAVRWYEAAAALAPGNRELQARIERLTGATSTPAEDLPQPASP
ncbi:hypothetical protein EPO33_01745 [Patescibacteria group bacterium]|nr:MAG: hypothetical protein EPO33_01745 [Patescibacteria group bacterium]